MAVIISIIRLYSQYCLPPLLRFCNTSFWFNFYTFFHLDIFLAVFLVQD